MRLFKKGIFGAWASFHIDIEGSSTTVCGYRLKVANASYRVRVVRKMSRGARDEMVVSGS